jgi:hypothetical protein
VIKISARSGCLLAARAKPKGPSGRFGRATAPPVFALLLTGGAFEGEKWMNDPRRAKTRPNLPPDRRGAAGCGGLP